MHRIVTATLRENYFADGTTHPAGTRVEVVCYMGRTTNTDEPLDLVRFIDADEVVQTPVPRAMLINVQTEEVEA